MKKKWILATLLGMVVLFILCIGGKKYMDKKAVEKSYQDGMELIQNYVTDYLVKNYEGIEKIEWQGVGVEWRNSDVFGSSILGNYVNSNVHVYISKDSYFTMEFRLSDETEYDDDLKKYVLYEYDGISVLNPSNIDISVATGIHNAIYSYSDDPDVKNLKVNEKEKRAFERIKKASPGSTNAEIIYNLEIHKLTY